MIAHPHRARDYEALKMELVRRFDGDKEAYIKGKDGLVQKIQTEALAWFQKRTLIKS